MQVTNPSGTWDASSVDIGLDPMPSSVESDLLVITILTSREDEPDLCEAGTIAGAAPIFVEEVTGRPLIAYLLLCKFYERLPDDLAVVAHELMHALVFHPFLIDALYSYSSGQAYEGLQPLAEDEDGKVYIATPQARLDPVVHTLGRLLAWCMRCSSVCCCAGQAQALQQAVERHCT